MKYVKANDIAWKNTYCTATVYQFNFVHVCPINWVSDRREHTLTTNDCVSITVSVSTKVSVTDSSFTTLHLLIEQEELTET